jgi:hypothetical protein
MVPRENHRNMQWTSEVKLHLEQVTYDVNKKVQVI